MLLPLRGNRLFSEFDIDISYKFSSGNATGNNEWFFKRFLRFQYRINQALSMQILGDYGGDDTGSKELWYFRTGVAMSF